jgi:hypothetical protein
VEALFSNGVVPNVGGVVGLQYTAESIVQPVNALLPTLVTFAGMVISVRPVQPLNTVALIAFNDAGNDIDVIPDSPAKELPGILVISPLNVIIPLPVEESQVCDVISIPPA